MNLLYLLDLEIALILKQDDCTLIRETLLEICLNGLKQSLCQLDFSQGVWMLSIWLLGWYKIPHEVIHWWLLVITSSFHLKNTGEIRIGILKCREKF